MAWSTDVPLHITPWDCAGDGKGQKQTVVTLADMKLDNSEIQVSTLPL